jgi:hypothetical protein
MSFSVPQNLSFLPAAIQNVIQDGILERKMYEALKPLLLWRNLCQQERHPGQIGERVIKTRTGLIAPDTEQSAKRSPGTDPATVTRSVEQFSYQIAPFGKSLDVHLPSSYLAMYNRFLDDTNALGFHCAQTMGRIARGRMINAYGGGDSFATALGNTSTSVPVKNVAGFFTVMVNGVPTAISSQNPLPATLSGTTSVNITACTPNTTGATSGPGTLTLSAAQTWAKWDRIVATDAPKVVRAGGRSTDQAILTTDVATAAVFRQAAAQLRSDNVPALDGSRDGVYGCFVDPQTETALFSDSEFHDAIKAMGLTGPFADGAIGDYAGVRFIRNTEMTKLAADADYQATIHESLLFGAEPLIEAYIPEEAFAEQVTMSGIASANHFKMPLDEKAVMTMVLRAPLDRAGEVISASWLANADYCVPTDSQNQTSNIRYKRAALIHTAGPA